MLGFENHPTKDDRDPIMAIPNFGPEYYPYLESLYKATLTRVLTKEEFEDLMALDYNIFVRNGFSFNLENYQKRFFDLVYHQLRLRVLMEGKGDI